MNIEFIDLTEVQKDVVHCYAHRTGNEKKSMEQRQKETLIEHTELCQQYYEKIVEHKQIQVVFEQFEKLYFSEMSREGIHFFETMRDNVITFHDIGKINPRFQEKNMGNYELKGKARPDNSVEQGKFLSKDDFRDRTKVSKTVIDLMDDLKLFGDIPQSNQMSLFDFTG